MGLMMKRLCNICGREMKMPEPSSSSIAITYEGIDGEVVLHAVPKLPKGHLPIDVCHGCFSRFAARLNEIYNGDDNVAQQ